MYLENFMHACLFAYFAYWYYYYYYYYYYLISYVDLKNSYYMYVYRNLYLLHKTPTHTLW